MGERHDRRCRDKTEAWYGESGSMTMANYSGAILNNIQYYILLNDAYRTIEVRVLLAKVNWSIANCKISAG